MRLLKSWRQQWHCCKNKQKWIIWWFMSKTHPGTYTQGLEKLKASKLGVKNSPLCCWSLALCVCPSLSPLRWHEGKEIFYRSSEFVYGIVRRLRSACCRLYLLDHPSVNATPPVGGQTAPHTAAPSSLLFIRKCAAMRRQGQGMKSRSSAWSQQYVQNNVKIFLLLL